ncbi:MAG: WbqC family protein [Duncaniella sp.]|nr:WbqC family protein [Duncaniella sp.]
MSRPVPYPSLALALPPRLCGEVGLYVAAWSAGCSAQRWDIPFDKRDKATHRFTIADTRGRLDLTVPIVKPHSHRCLWNSIEVSAHGGWWDVHRVALESAYGRTPYFEFYIDRFLPMLSAGVTERFPLLVDLALAWDAEIRSCLGLEIDRIDDAIPLVSSIPATLTPYRQIRAGRLGFISGLSILDLLFNLGPEAQLWLHANAFHANGPRL